MRTMPSPRRNTPASPLSALWEERWSRADTPTAKRNILTSVCDSAGLRWHRDGSMYSFLDKATGDYVGLCDGLAGAWGFARGYRSGLSVEKSRRRGSSGTATVMPFRRTG